MGIIAGIALLLIIIIVFAYAGSELMSFVTDTSSAVAQKIRDNETKIPNAPVGSTVCDLFLTATWREKNSVGFPVAEQILFTNTEGKTVIKEVNNCGTVAPASNSLLTLLDFFGTKKSMTPLDLIIPEQQLFESTFKMSFVLVNEDGYEKKLPHYQNIEYKIPASTFEYDFEQKLIFRDVQAGQYILELRPDDAKWNDHGENQPYRQNISVP